MVGRIRRLQSLSAISTLLLLAGLVGFLLVERNALNGQVAAVSRVQSLGLKARELSLYVQYNAHDTNAYTLGHLEHRQEYDSHAEQFRRVLDQITRDLASSPLDRNTERALNPIGPERERYDRASLQLFRAADQNRRDPTPTNQQREDAAWEKTDKLGDQLDELSQVLARAIATQARGLQDHIEAQNRRIIPIVLALALLIGGLIVLIQSGLARARARAQFAARTAQELLSQNKSILDAAGDGIYGLDADGRTTFANPAAARLTGHEVDELIGRRWQELVPHTAPGGTPHPAVASGTLQRGDDDLYRRKDGTSFAVEYTSTPIIADGQVPGAVVVFKDISERRAAEAALTASEHRTRQILQTAHDAFVAMDADGLILDWNPQAEVIFGWSRDEALGRDLAETIVPERHRDAHRRGLARFLATGEGPVLNQRVELTALHRGAREFPIELTISSLRTEDDWTFNAFVRDIGDRRAAEELLERQRQQLLEAQSVGGFGSWEWDVAAGTLAWSDELCRIYGLEPDGRAPSFEQAIEPVHPDDRARVSDEITRAVTSGEPLCSEYRVVRPDGGLRIAQIRGEVLLDEHGSALRMVGTVQDITERREVERAKDEFVSVVSHELRTPLTSIRGSLGLLESGVLGALPERGQRMVEIAVQNTDRLVRLINDILDIERIHAGTIDMHAEPCEATELIERAVTELRPLADEALVSLVTASQSAALLADADRVHQTLTNLISNAVKFSQAGTTVRVSCERRGDEVLFEVADHGRGIPPAKLETIFERFQQVDASDSREKGGTGLGLAICRTIVEHHGGRIWAQSELGRGSTLAFVLPALHSQLPATDLGEGPCILLCDNDAAVVEVVGELLRSRGYRVIETHSGAQALQRALDERPDAILLDLLMPGMSGWETAAALNERPETADIPIVILSVLSQAESEAPSGAVVDWVEKPLDEAALFTALAHAVGARSDAFTVLVVEDDPDLADVLVATFRRHGVETFQAGTGTAAIKLIQQVLPDMLVLDLGLPEADGFEVVQWLRRHRRLRTLPMVVYTARELDDADRERLRLDSSTAFLTKGRIAPEEFEHRVMALLGQLTKDRIVESGDEPEAHPVGR